MTEKCKKCNESWRGHEQPYSFIPRDCNLARIYRDAPDSIFCRYPEICSVTGKCWSQQKYGRACND